MCLIYVLIKSKKFRVCFILLDISKYAPQKGGEVKNCFAFTYSSRFHFSYNKTFYAFHVGPTFTNLKYIPSGHIDASAAASSGVYPSKINRATRVSYGK